MNAFQKTGEKMTNYRWTICAMLFFATTVNYLDRQVLSLTWDEFIKPEFHWDESHYGTITSVFSIFYAIYMLYADSPADSFLRSPPLNTAARKETTYSVKNRKNGRDKTVVGFISVKYRFDKFIPGER